MNLERGCRPLPMSRASWIGQAHGRELESAIFSECGAESWLETRLDKVRRGGRGVWGEL